MRHRLTILIVAAALLVAGTPALHAATGGDGGRGSHACCPEQLRTNCHGQTITCCTPADTSVPATALPVSPSLWHSAGLALTAGPAAVMVDAAAAARLAARLAHAAEACLQAPADPLFLKHLALLV
jgi:hypothetical protein